MPLELDADMLATLTPEERAAIETNAYSPQELQAMQRLADKADAEAGSSDGSADDDDDEGDNDPETGAAGDGQAKPGSDDGAGKSAAEPAADDKPESDEPPVEPSAPRYEAKLPEDFEAKVTALGERESGAWEKFESGELDRNALQAELQAIASERQELQSLKTKAEISQEMTQQTAAQQWQNTVNRNLREFAKPENGGIDYRKDESKSADLDQFVKFLANKPENADKPMDWFLQEAHKRVQALHGIAPVQRESKEEVVNKAKDKRKNDPAKAPATLAQVPGGDGPGDVAGEFAHLDALDGNDLEAAIAKMTPAQREKYSMGL